MLQHVLDVFGAEWRCTTCTGRDKKPPIPPLWDQCGELPSQNPPRGSFLPCRGLRFNPSVSSFGDDFHRDVDSSELPYLPSYDHGCAGDCADSDPTPYVEVTGASHRSSLKHCARKLQRFALKTRLSLQDEDDHETNAQDEMFEALRSAESACNVVLETRESTENVSPSASKSTVAMSRSVAVSRSVAEHTTSRPSTWRSYGMGPRRTGGSLAHDGAGVRSRGMKGEGVNGEYERRDVSSMIKDLRTKMRSEGVSQESELSTDSARLAEVHAYQEAMRTKFEALGVHGARAQRFRTTRKSTEAVRDAVAAYHTHCQKLGRFYAAPGDPPEAHGLDAKEWEQLTHYAQVLNSRSLGTRPGHGVRTNA